MVIIPVGMVQEGCKIFAVGACGAVVCTLIIKFVKGDKQPLIFFATRLWFPTDKPVNPLTG